MFVLELQLLADLVQTTECVVSCLQQPVVTSPFSPINSSSARQSLHTRSTTNALQLPSNVSALGWKLNLIPQWYAGIMNWVSCLWATGAALKYMWGSVTQGIGRWLRGEVNMSRWSRLNVPGMPRYQAESFRRSMGSRSLSVGFYNGMSVVNTFIKNSRPLNVLIT